MTLFYLVHKPENWVCAKCSKRERRARNCEGNPKRKDFTFLFHPRLPSTAINKCPRAFMDPQMERLFEQYGIWKRFGLWPVQGGLDDQPARLVDAFSVIATTLDTYEALEAEKRKAEGNKLDGENSGTTGGKRPPLRPGRR